MEIMIAGNNITLKVTCEKRGKSFTHSIQSNADQIIVPTHLAQMYVGGPRLQPAKGDDM